MLRKFLKKDLYNHEIDLKRNMFKSISWLYMFNFTFYNSSLLLFAMPGPGGMNPIVRYPCLEAQHRYNIFKILPFRKWQP